MSIFKKVCFVLIVSLFAVLLASEGAEATAQYYTFNISLYSITEDTANAGLNGYDTWYQWLYEVEVIPGGDEHNALSHFTLETLLCYDEDWMEVIATTAGANGNSPNPGNLEGLVGNELRLYEFETGTDGSLGLYGVKWNMDSDETFDTIGDIDYFWFSAPTNISETTQACVKFGDNDVCFDIESPECPGCHEVPEPATLALLGTGLLGFAGLRKKQNKNKGGKV